MDPLEMQLSPCGPLPPSVTNGLSGLKPTTNTLQILIFFQDLSAKVAFERRRRKKKDCLMPRQKAVLLADIDYLHHAMKQYLKLVTPPLPTTESTLISCVFEMLE